jgi:hypothetical protein
MITVPGNRVVDCERNDTVFLTLNICLLCLFSYTVLKSREISYLVLPFCTTSPLSIVLKDTACGFGISVAETNTGPSGLVSSKLLEKPH